MRSRLAILSVLGIGFCLTAPVNAAERAISLNPSSMVTDGAATQTSVINLPESGTGGFRVNFVLPPDYAQGTVFRLRAYMQTTAGCTGQFQVANAVRRRPNFASYGTNSPNIDNVVPSGGLTTAVFPAGATVVVKIYLVKPPAAASFTGTKPGDGFDIRIDRLPADAADTCTGTIFVTHVEVRYEVAP